MLNMKVRLTINSSGGKDGTGKKPVSPLSTEAKPSSIFVTSVRESAFTNSFSGQGLYGGDSTLSLISNDGKERKLRKSRKKNKARKTGTDHFSPFDNVSSSLNQSSYRTAMLESRQSRKPLNKSLLSKRISADEIYENNSIAALTTAQRAERTVAARVVKEKSFTLGRTSISSVRINNLIKSKSGNQCPATSYGGCLRKRPIKKRVKLNKLTMRQEEYLGVHRTKNPFGTINQDSATTEGNIIRHPSCGNISGNHLLDPNFKSQSSVLDPEKYLSSGFNLVSSEKEGDKLSRLQAGHIGATLLPLQSLEDLRPWSQKGNGEETLDNYWEKNRMCKQLHPEKRKNKANYAPVVNFPVFGGETNKKSAALSHSLQPRPLTRTSSRSESAKCNLGLFDGDQLSLSFIDTDYVDEDGEPDDGQGKQQSPNGVAIRFSLSPTTINLNDGSISGIPPRIITGNGQLSSFPSVGNIASWNVET